MDIQGQETNRRPKDRSSAQEILHMPLELTGCTPLNSHNPLSSSQIFEKPGTAPFHKPSIPHLFSLMSSSVLSESFRKDRGNSILFKTDEIPDAWVEAGEMTGRG